MMQRTRGSLFSPFRCGLIPAVRSGPRRLCSLLIVLLLSLIACKKSDNNPKPLLTPLQAYVNGDTTLNMFRRLMIQGNQAGLLSNNPMTVLLVDNAAFRSAGYTDTLIDSLRATLAARQILYHFINSPVSPAKGSYTAYPGQTGYNIFGMQDENGTIWFNGTPAKGSSSQVGNVLLYKMTAPLQGPADSLTSLLAGDSTLSFLAEAFRRTNLYDSLLLNNNFTILAPNNKAFITAGYDSIGAIDSANFNKLVSLLEYHIVPGLYFSNTLMGLTSLTNYAGATLSVSNQGGSLQFAGPGNSTPAGLRRPNQTAGNNIVVHRIDQVLSP